MRSNAPIFVVGVPRSGTTLLAAVLGAHSRLSCGPETHFFSELSEQQLSTGVKGWPSQAARYVHSIRHLENTVVENYRLSAADVSSFLRSKAPSVSAMMAALTEQYMQRAGKQRWVEKTPDHLPYVTDIRRHFPNSPVIRIVRDPRDVALSLMAVPWGASTFYEALGRWLAFDAASEGFFGTDPLVYTLRYEDLVGAPQQTARKLCDFIGEDFEESMLCTSGSAASVNPMAEPWKQKVSKPIDAASCGRWRSALSTTERALVECLVGNRLGDFHYERDHYEARYVSLFPRAAVGAYPALMEYLLQSRLRIWREEPSERPCAELFVGAPWQEGWPMRSATARVRAAATVVGRVTGARCRGREVLWWRERNKRAARRPLALLLCAALAAGSTVLRNDTWQAPTSH